MISDEFAAGVSLLLAIVAGPVDLEAVAGGEVVVFLADLAFQVFQFGGKEFHRASALGTDHVVVSAAVVLMFVTRDAVMEGDFTGKAAFGEKLEGAIDGSETDLRVLLADHAVKLVGGKVVASVKEGAEDGVALASVLEAYLLQVLMKDGCSFAQHFARDCGLIINPFRQHVESSPDGAGHAPVQISA